MSLDELLQFVNRSAKEETIELKLADKELTSLPPEIGKLITLTTLDLSGNQLTSLPDSIMQLTNLKLLDLSDNQLTSLPDSIMQLTNLRWLDLSGNQLTSLPDSIMRLTNLQWLALSNNQLTSLPDAIAQLTNLHSLHLFDNQLTSLPNAIAQLTNLHSLDLSDNLLPIPPEILDRYKEPATIISFYLKLKTQQPKPLNEAKMLLVGQGRVGKTSLVKRLIDDRFDPHERSTDKINIQPWLVFTFDRTIRLNVWDFGGQEIMHATHQFFLTKRSLYLLVIDNTLGEDENRLEYWLKIIQSFGSNSPIILVGNKTDQRPLDIDEHGLKSKYPNIKAILQISCYQGVGIPELKAAIAQELGNAANEPDNPLKHIYDLFPAPYLALKQQLEHKGRDYIPYHEYEQMCRAHNITDDLTQQTLIKLLHDLGIVLNFQDDDRLQDTNVLNPEWVTTGIYKIINHNTLITEHQGILAKSMLSDILDRICYPPKKHLFILDMMHKFELCFEVDRDSKWLIPDLLPKGEPDTGDWSNALEFQYHYAVLPSSIMSRFIVRTSHLASKKTYWRNGIVLQFEQNRALVKADREDKKIFIKILGSQPTRRDSLSKIRSQFDYIHNSFKDLEITQQVPIPDSPDHLQDYDDLIIMEREREQTIYIAKLKQRFQVKDLLNGIESEHDRQHRHDDARLTRTADHPKVIINNFLENRPDMSNVYQNHSGSGDNVARDKNTKNVYHSQNLTQAAQEIKQLLDHLSLQYGDPTIAGAEAIKQIKQDKTLKTRVVNAIKEGGAEAFEKLVDHPAVSIVLAAAKGFIEE